MDIIFLVVGILGFVLAIFIFARLQTEDFATAVSSLLATYAGLFLGAAIPTRDFDLESLENPPDWLTSHILSEPLLSIWGRWPFSLSFFCLIVSIGILVFVNSYDTGVLLFATVLVFLAFLCGAGMGVGIGNSSPILYWIVPGLAFGVALTVQWLGA